MRLSPLMYTAITAACLAVTPLHARDAQNVIMPEDPERLAFKNAVGYADAVISGDIVYVSGVMAVPAAGETDPKLAYDRVFVTIGKTLDRAGVGWDDVVDMTTYHTDLRGQINAFAAVKSRYIKAPFPSWTAIGTSELFDPKATVEIKIVAQRPDED